MTDNPNITELLHQVDFLSDEDRMEFLYLLIDKLWLPEFEAEQGQQIKNLIPVKPLDEKPKAPVSDINDYRASRPAVDISEFRKRKNGKPSNL